MATDVKEASAGKFKKFTRSPTAGNASGGAMSDDDNAVHEPNPVSVEPTFDADAEADDFMRALAGVRGDDARAAHLADVRHVPAAIRTRVWDALVSSVSKTPWDDDDDDSSDDEAVSAALDAHKFAAADAMRHHIQQLEPPELFRKKAMQHRLQLLVVRICESRKILYSHELVMLAANFVRAEPYLPLGKRFRSLEALLSNSSMGLYDAGGTQKLFWYRRATRVRAKLARVCACKGTTRALAHEQVGRKNGTIGWGGRQIGRWQIGRWLVALTNARMHARMHGCTY